MHYCDAPVRRDVITSSIVVGILGVLESELAHGSNNGAAGLVPRLCGVVMKPQRENDNVDVDLRDTFRDKSVASCDVVEICVFVARLPGFLARRAHELVAACAIRVCCINSAPDAVGRERHRFYAIAIAISKTAAN